MSLPQTEGVFSDISISMDEIKPYKWPYHVGYQFRELNFEGEEDSGTRDHESTDEHYWSFVDSVETRWDDEIMKKAEKEKCRRFSEYLKEMAAQRAKMDEMNAAVQMAGDGCHVGSKMKQLCDRDERYLELSRQLKWVADCAFESDELFN